jgi:hypothetical protein
MTDHPKRPRDPNQLAKSIVDISPMHRLTTSGFIGGRFKITL